jgi:hypothetical protein
MRGAGFLQSDCDWWQSDLGFLKSEVVWVDELKIRINFTHHSVKR